MSSNVNEVRLCGRLMRMDVRKGESKNQDNPRPYVSVTYTLAIEENEIQVKSFAMQFKNDGEETSGYKAIMTLYDEAKALHKSMKNGDEDAVIEKAENNPTIVENIEECEIIKTSSYKDFKYSRFGTNIRKGADGNIIKSVEINANYVNRGKEDEEFNPKNYFAITGKVINAPIELEDENENPYVKFTLLVPIFQKGYTKKNGDVVEDKVDLHEIELKTYDEDVFDFILDEFEKDSFIQLNGQIVRIVERIEKEVETDDGRRTFGRKAEVQKSFETKTTFFIEPLGGFRYDDGELEEDENKVEFNVELWEQGLKELEDKISKLENDEENEQPKGFGRNDRSNRNGSNKNDSKGGSLPF